MEFRTLLIKLFNQLSDSDRQALHFSVGNQIPRNYRDNCTPNGSLHLLDSLFDQNLITEQNFDYLINIFEQINCHNASAQLKGLYIIFYLIMNCKDSLLEYKVYTVRTSIAELISSTFNEFENDKMRSFSSK